MHMRVVVTLHALRNGKSREVSEITPPINAPEYFRPHYAVKNNGQ